MNVLSQRVVTIWELSEVMIAGTGSPSAGLWGSTVSHRVNARTPSPARLPPAPIARAELFLASGVTVGHWRRSGEGNGVSAGSGGCGLGSAVGLPKYT